MTHWMALGQKSDTMPDLSTVKSLCYLTSRNSIMVITFRCGRNNPGSIPGYGMFFCIGNMPVSWLEIKESLRSVYELLILFRKNAPTFFTVCNLLKDRLKRHGLFDSVDKSAEKFIWLFAQSREEKNVSWFVSSEKDESSSKKLKRKLLVTYESLIFSPFYDEIREFNALSVARQK